MTEESKLTETKERLRLELKDLETRRNECRNDLIRLEKEAPHVARVLKFKDGTFTHAVICRDYGIPMIVDRASDELKQQDYHDRPMRDTLKLIALWGDSKGDLGFRICRYADGSSQGFTGSIDLFGSYEEALEHLKAEWSKTIREWMDAVSNFRVNWGLLKEMIKAAPDYGIEDLIPKELIDDLAALNLEAAKSQRDAKAKELEEAEAKYSGLRMKASMNTGLVSVILFACLSLVGCQSGYDSIDQTHEADRIAQWAADADSPEMDAAVDRVLKDGKLTMGEFNEIYQMKSIAEARKITAKAKAERHAKIMKEAEELLRKRKPNDEYWR